jgi:hypothetical protein
MQGLKRDSSIRPSWTVPARPSEDIMDDPTLKDEFWHDRPGKRASFKPRGRAYVPRPKVKKDGDGDDNGSS